MSGDERAKPPVPSGYRTLVPGQGVLGQSKAPAGKPAPAANAATQPAPAKPVGQPTSAPDAKSDPKSEGEKPHEDPTRFGDWEVKGRCIDF